MFDAQRWNDAQIKVDVTTDRSFHMVQAAIDEVRPLKTSAKHIRPRHTTNISVVASDGGHNMIEAYNFLPLGVIRVVDSHGKELFFDVIGPEDDTNELSASHLSNDTALGRMMTDLKVTTLNELSPMIPVRPDKPGWMTVYRDLCEWAAIYDLVCHRTPQANTLVLRDGLLRSKIFAKDLFVQLGRKIKKRIEEVQREERRDIYLVGLAKKSEALIRYGVALQMVNAFEKGSAWYVPVPMELQNKVYVWPEYIRLPDEVAHHGVGGGPVEDPKYNIGEMHFVRFGHRQNDPVWTVDTMWFQKDQAGVILGSLLGDTEQAFPIPAYPMSLQEADRNAQVSGFQRDMLQDHLLKAIRARLDTDQQQILDTLPFSQNVAARRYQ